MELYDEVMKRKENIITNLNDWSIGNLRDFPWRRNITPYKILVAEIMLRRTTASAVNKIYESFLEKYSSLYHLANADINAVEKYMIKLGYHKKRSKILIETCKTIINNYDGSIPSDITTLKKIHHIGPYIAGAIVSQGYGIKAIMVDSNVERVIKNMFNSYMPENRIQTALRKIVQQLVPEEDHQTFNLALIDLGGLVCTYRKAHHNKCPLKNYCDSYLEFR